ncbi:MAG: hypothetical protein K6C94_00025 [Candidatus Gastranaerophilales bacterium]|nr:hypothetical protein [Candidatus Gastranaerophilales bacterium]
MRLKQVCHVCGSPNRFGEEHCLNCGSTLIKYCENCGSANLASAKTCRKCVSPLPAETVADIGENIYVIKTDFSKITKSADSSLLSKVKIIEKEDDDEKINTTADYQPEVSDELPAPQTSDLYEEDENYDEYGEEINTENLPPQQEEQADYQTDYRPDYLQANEQKENDTDLEGMDDIEPVSPENNDEIVFLDSSEQMLSQLTNIIKTENNAVVTGICAEEGMGKTSLIKSFTETLSEEGILAISAENSELVKISPFGCIRDCLLKILTLPDIHPDINKFYSDETKQLFLQNFPDLTNDETENFMNFLYPAKQGTFADLAPNKQYTHALLEKIFTSIVTNNNVVFIIDNFEMTDNASFEFIKQMITKGIINNKTKLFITYKERCSARAYFDKDLAKQDIFATMYLNNLNEEETTKFIQNFANTEVVPTAVSYAVNEKGRGNIFFTEQFLALLFDVGYIFISSNTMKFKDDEPIPFLPKNIDEIIKLRFDSINDQDMKDALIAAAIMGYKFDKKAFATVTDISVEQAGELLQKLTDYMFIQPVSDYEYTFKNMSMWSIIFNEANKDPRFKVICKKVYYVLSNYALSNPIIKTSAAQSRDERETAIQAWQETASLCAYLGDDNIYTLAMEQLLLQTGYNENAQEYTDIQLKAMELISKIIYKTIPSKAVKYLTAPIKNAHETENLPKLIELCGYMIKACYLISDYNGVIETTDLILKSADDALSPLDKALIKAKKLHALYKTGNCEEGLNLANNDIISQLEEALSKENNEEAAKSLFMSWFDTSVNMVYLYAVQGNSKALEIADNTVEIMQMNGIQEPEYTVKLNIAKAFALTVIGKVNDSDSILEALEHVPEYDKPEFIAQRNLISATNRVLSDNKENLRNILFDYAKYAENANDVTGKHIYKLMLAWLTAQEGDYNQASVIFNEELTYFAKEKIVTGALISWLFIAQNNMMTDGIENAEHVAMKALEVAQNPKFSQYHLAVYLQKLIAEINLTKGDAASAKMYLEKGMLTAKQFGLDLAQIELYRTYAQFLGYMMTQDSAHQADFADKANKIYKAALVSADNLKIESLTQKINEENQQFINYCQTNGIAAA